MSVIVKDEEGKILLLCKGADSVMFERLAKSGREFEEITREHVNEYADAGLRTLILAYREITKDKYQVFNEQFSEAKNSVSADRDAMIDEATEKIENELILLGATAVEDKLQQGVPECIDKLAQVGIKIWVLTGDKMETAINIGYACSLLRQGMKQIIINLETPDIIATEKGGDKDAIARASKEKDDTKRLLLDLAIGCASDICCRSSPKQKALVTRLVKFGTGKTSLAIGDEANDVGMFQES
ncbi:hypothetical protein K7X08_031455 [Anisodus acutangulus]|uniref:Phospholipid-transporting ATPase n=1 Tax=Anisodus acutangulus TaxID=402998 RepID=A0A9Q1MPQ1_9SOLA|nr:hypothetical protein K7X08_031455 [Anisodus acutangulus]